MSLNRIKTYPRIRVGIQRKIGDAIAYGLPGDGGQVVVLLHVDRGAIGTRLIAVQGQAILRPGSGGQRAKRGRVLAEHIAAGAAQSLRIGGRVRVHMAIGGAGPRLGHVIDAVYVVHHHAQPGHVEQGNPRQLAPLLISVVQLVLGQQILEDAQGMAPHVSHLVEAALQLLEQQARQKVLAAELLGESKVLHHLRRPVLRIQHERQIEGHIVLVLADLLEEVELVLVEYAGIARRKLAHIAANQAIHESPVHVAQALAHKPGQRAIQQVRLLAQVLIPRGDVRHQDLDQLLHSIGILLGEPLVPQHPNPASGQQVLGHAFNDQIEEDRGVTHELVDDQEIRIAGIQEEGQVPAEFTVHGPLPRRLLAVVGSMEHILHIGPQEVWPLGLVAYQVDNVRYQPDDIQANLLGLGVHQQGEQLIEDRRQVVYQRTHVNGMGCFQNLARFRFRRHSSRLASLQQSLAVPEEVVQVLVRRQDCGIQPQTHRIEVPLIIDPLDVRPAVLLRNWKGL